MTIQQLVRPTHVIAYWEFISSGLQYLTERAYGTYDLEEQLKYLTWLVSNGGYICIVLEDDGTPIGFGVAESQYNLFSTGRTFEVKAVYYINKNQLIAQAMLGAFEQFCKKNGVNRLVITTKRNTGSTIRCFRHAEYGFKKPYLTFEKEIK